MSRYAMVKMQISEEVEIFSKYCADTFPYFQHCLNPRVFFVCFKISFTL